MRNKMKRIGASVLGTGGLLVASLAMVGTAVATPGINNVGPDQPGHPADGSLTIHKYEGDLTGQANDGTEISVANDPMEGVKFTYQQVAHEGTAIDLTDPAGWDLLGDAGVNAWDEATHSLKDGFTLIGSPVEGITNASGVIEWTNVPLGAYVVTETDTSGAKVNGQPVTVVEESLPFLVTVPLPYASGGWIYDVNVYPKNQVMQAPHKSVGDPTKMDIETDVPWTITATVPKLNEGDFTEAVITDPLDARLTYKSAVIKAGDTTFVEGQDYTVSDNVIFTFTPDGLTALKAESGKELTVDLVTTVTGIASGDLQPGQIPNQADVKFNDTTLPTEEVQTNFGGLLVKKTDSKTHETLAGAEFAVYELPAGGSCDALDGETPVTTGATDADGIYAVEGLWVGNNTVLAKDYCLVETKAPAGYKVVDGAQKVTISAEGTAILSVDVENTPATPGTMPPTGAMGTVALATGGIALLGLGGYLALRNRKTVEA